MLSTTHASETIRFATTAPKGSSRSDSLGEWAQSAKAIALDKAQANISPPDGEPGAVLASPSRRDPDYYYHWVRDGARTMRAFVHLYDTAEAGQRAAVKNGLFEMLERYVLFSRLNQVTPTLTGLGEPKFQVTGEAFDGPWGRPQNDGPAQRALVLTRWAKHLLQDGREDYVRAVLYDGRYPNTYSVIKADLEFVAHNWQSPCFDLWEELHGNHFFTRLQQRVALAEGATLAQTLGDGGAASFYREQAQAIADGIDMFWSSDRNYILSSTGTSPSIDSFKPTNLDAAVVIASAETFSLESPFYAPDSDRVLATAYALHEQFRKLYPINEVTETKKGEPLFPAIGRYPGDTYNGGPVRDGGNPWFLCTLALAEVCYKASSLLRGRTNISVNERNVGYFNLAIALANPRERVQVGSNVMAGSRQFSALQEGLVAAGDAYLRRVRQHAGADGSLSEQFSRTDGLMLSARDLTWSYVAMVLAANWREQVAR